MQIVLHFAVNQLLILVTFGFLDLGVSGRPVVQTCYLDGVISPSPAKCYQWEGVSFFEKLQMEAARIRRRGARGHLEHFQPSHIWKLLQVDSH